MKTSDTTITQEEFYDAMGLNSNINKKLYNDFIYYESDALSANEHFESWMKYKPKLILSKKEFEIWN